MIFSYYHEGFDRRKGLPAAKTRETNASETSYRAEEAARGRKISVANPK
jgi:hypothetical protein